MNRYEIIIYWSKEDHAFIAEVPELPGCMALSMMPRFGISKMLCNCGLKPPRNSAIPFLSRRDIA